MYKPKNLIIVFVGFIVIGVIASVLPHTGFGQAPQRDGVAPLNCDQRPSNGDGTTQLICDEGPPNRDDETQINCDEGPSNRRPCNAVTRGRAAFNDRNLKLGGNGRGQAVKME